jgi:hypothetical protein
VGSRFAAWRAISRLLVANVLMDGPAFTATLTETGANTHQPSKHRDSVYRGGRSDRWIKNKNRQHPAFSRVMDQF